jgi:hypothetical protein
MNYTIKYFPKKIFSISLLAFLIFINNNAGNSFSMSPEQKLMLGAEKNRVNLIKIAIESAVDINTKDKYGNNALHIAVKFNNIDATKVLIEYGININGENKTKNTPLHVAAQRNSVHCLNILLKHGANTNFQNSFGRTPLHIAAIYNPKNYNYEEEAIITFIAKKEIIKLLIFFGANIKIQDEDNRTVKAMTKNIEIKKTIDESVKTRNRFKNKLQRLKKQLKIKSEARKKTKKSKIIKKAENLKIVPGKSKDEIITTITKKLVPQNTTKPIIAKPFIQTKIDRKAEKEKLKQLLREQSKERQKTERQRKSERKKVERKRESERKILIKEKFAALERLENLTVPTEYLQSILRTIKTSNDFKNKNEKIEIIKALLKMYLSRKKFDHEKYLEKIFKDKSEFKKLPKITRSKSCPSFGKIKSEKKSNYSTPPEPTLEPTNSQKTYSPIPMSINSGRFSPQYFIGKSFPSSFNDSIANSFQPGSLIPSYSETNPKTFEESEINLSDYEF